MKKIGIILWIFVGISTVFGQNTQKIKFGVHAGVTGSDIFYQQFDAKIRKLGYQIGASVDFSVGDVYWISTGVTFTQLGDREIFENDPSIPIFIPLPTMKTRHINYLQIPLLFSMRERGLRFDAGIYGGYGLKGYEKLEMTVMTQPEPYDLFRNESQLMRRFDGGFQTGIGYSSRFGVDFMLNAQLGLVKLEEEFGFGILPFPLPPAEPVGFKGRNLGLSATIGYRF